MMWFASGISSKDRLIVLADRVALMPGMWSFRAEVVGWNPPYAFGNGLCVSALLRVRRRACLPSADVFLD